jgi:hypothetical protein
MYSFLKKVLEAPNQATASSTAVAIEDDQPWLHLLDRSTVEYLKFVYYSKGIAPRYAKVDFRTGQAQWWKRSFEEHLILPVEVIQNRLQFAPISGESK